MFYFNSKKAKICFWGMVISCLIMLIVFYATDDLLGDKEFSDYTRADWSIAVLPLSVIVVSGVSSLVFALFFIIQVIRYYPSLLKYTVKLKYSDFDSETEFLVFDHNEFKRACCRTVDPYGLWISEKE